MHAKLGTKYHWIPELYRRMKLPVFEGIVEALEKHNMQRKRALELAKTTPAKKRRVELKKRRVMEAKERIQWSKRHGQHTNYGGNDDIDDLGEHGSSDVAGQRKRGDGKSQRKGKCPACGSSAHQRSSHRDCPLKKNAKKESQSQNAQVRYADASDIEVSSDDFSDSGGWIGASSDSCASEESVFTLCTCGAEGRAHKKGCPQNSRKLYSGRTLFSETSSLLRVSSPKATGSKEVPEREARSVAKEGLGAPSTKRTKLAFKVGECVCVHSSSFSGYHVVCRVVKEVGSCYQLLCSKGVLNTLFSGSALAKLSSSCALPLDKWRLAPKVSLGSVTKDPAILEQCNCNLPKCSEPFVTLSSASEDENTKCNTWVRNVLYSLTQDDQRTVASPFGWLTDQVISAAQILLLQHFPHMSGLQPPTLQQVCAFQVHSGEFVQIVNVRNNHWCVVSSVGCEGVVNVYDSLYSSVSKDTVSLVASMVHSSASSLVVRTMNVEKQKNGSDCGVLSIAYAFDICSGFDPCVVRYDHEKIRQHLVLCLENCQFSRFPLSGDRDCVPVKSSKSCRTSLFVSHA